MRKRTAVAIFLGILVFIQNVSQCVYAKDENAALYQVFFSMEDNIICEEAFIQDDEIYMDINSFEKYTYYSYDPSSSMFMRNGQTDTTDAFSYMYFSAENKKLLKKDVKKAINLEDVIEYNYTYYLPVSVLFPALEAGLFLMDGILYPYSQEVSLTDALYGFDQQDYFFDFEKEFAGNTNLGVWGYIMPNYLFQSVLNFRWDRLDVVYGWGDINDYQSAISDYLQDDEVYLEAIGEENPSVEELVGIYVDGKKVNSSIKTILKLYSEYGDQIQMGDNLNVISEIESAIKEYHVGDIIELTEYISHYFNQVADHRNMLDATYQVGSNGTVTNNTYTTESRIQKAAQIVYDSYSLKDVGDLLTLSIETTTGMLEQGISDLAPIHKAVAAASKLFLSKAFPKSYKVSKQVGEMRTYVNLMLSVRESLISQQGSRYQDSETATENVRLSTIFYLLTVKTLNETMKSSFSYSNDSANATLYQDRIDDIDNRLKLLYLAGDNSHYNSSENVEEDAREIKHQWTEQNFLTDLQKNSILNSNPQISGDLRECYQYVIEHISDFADMDGCDSMYFTLEDLDANGDPELVYYVCSGARGFLVYLYIFSMQDNVLQSTVLDYYDLPATNSFLEEYYIESTGETKWFFNMARAKSDYLNGMAVDIEQFYFDSDSNTAWVEEIVANGVPEYEADTQLSFVQEQILFDYVNTYNDVKNVGRYLMLPDQKNYNNNINNWEVTFSQQDIEGMFTEWNL